MTTFVAEYLRASRIPRSACSHVKSSPPSRDPRAPPQASGQSGLIAARHRATPACPAKHVTPYGNVAPTTSMSDIRLFDAVDSNPEHLHHFVAQVVDDLGGDAPGGGFRKGAYISD